MTLMSTRRQVDKTEFSYVPALEASGRISMDCFVCNGSIIVLLRNPHFCSHWTEMNRGSAMHIDKNIY